MRDALEHILRGIPHPAIAVSGGVDSVTLAAVAAASIAGVTLMHAVSPAVPPEATARLRRLASERGWQLNVLEAGEFSDPRYLANPTNRCYFCKSNLYGAIRAKTNRQILSGANMDDLGEYRPGLLAAKHQDVRHPYVEAGIGKLAVRQIARDLRLHEVADLPSSPCLSSRIETGIRIETPLLEFVHSVERVISQTVGPRTVRCRIRAASVVVELDSETLGRLSELEKCELAALARIQPHSPTHLPVHFEPYRNGSAFLLKPAP